MYMYMYVCEIYMYEGTCVHVACTHAHTGRHAFNGRFPWPIRHLTHPGSDQEHIESWGCESEGVNERLGTHSCQRKNRVSSHKLQTRSTTKGLLLGERGVATRVYFFFAIYLFGEHCRRRGSPASPYQTWLEAGGQCWQSTDRSMESNVPLQLTAVLSFRAWQSGNEASFNVICLHDVCRKWREIKWRYLELSAISRSYMTQTDVYCIVGSCLLVILKRKVCGDNRIIIIIVITNLAIIVDLSPW